MKQTYVYKDCKKIYETHKKTIKELFPVFVGKIEKAELAILSAKNQKEQDMLRYLKMNGVEYYNDFKYDHVDEKEYVARKYIVDDIVIYSEGNTKEFGIKTLSDHLDEISKNPDAKLVEYLKLKKMQTTELGSFKKYCVNKKVAKLEKSESVKMYNKYLELMPLAEKIKTYLARKNEECEKIVDTLNQKIKRLVIRVSNDYVNAIRNDNKLLMKL